MSIALPLQGAPAVPVSDATSADRLLAVVLSEQRSTAVDDFAEWHHRESHDREAPPLQARYYRDLIPSSRPGAGEQLAFEVDLDACSGCKACVTACHNLNGLESGETWRSVGLLHGGTSRLPVLQHVTTACHHCLEPACLDGCPVEAYEKDPATGIVRHLDDQCIGCQYCILKCPYDVPKYSRSKGIVRKCDMCSSRLAVGEAPACVQACPNHAIRITVVNKQEAIDSAEANLFLPGTPEPRYTLPTTVYKTRRPLPVNMLPADYYTATPQHAHWPLVLMLVLTQMSVGAFVVNQILERVSIAPTSDAPAARTLRLGVAFVFGMIGLAASVFHLGRPLLAYRAVLGWRTSWLSREVLAFGCFAATASVYASIPLLEAGRVPISAAVENAIAAIVAMCGLAGTGCSTMIYASTRRALWNPAYTGLKFLLTGAVLGIPLALGIQLIETASRSPENFLAAVQQSGKWLSVALIAAAALKLSAEAAVFVALRARTFTPLRRTALLMKGDLRRPTASRFATGILGGIVAPVVLVLIISTGTASALAVLATVALSLALNIAGELLERYLFFAAVVAPKMPGAPAS
jgi:Fe-S-cluster-containing dehydrogenase component/DMSO reductase anchor subunit